MIIGRILGWLLLTVAVLVASGEAVLALGTGSYDGLATREVWTLLSGSVPHPAASANTIADLAARLLDWPAWVVIGALGLGLSVTCRPRPRRRRDMPRIHTFVS
ncbi:hypothetical protein [Rhodospirillum rubrum]|uniref:Uncharacterized protein n=1 Tax=Rhodospirillum rubrum (strain ATCC 11170 / ATH 1.1.1 / DSM 467 / LMG 4362 / NCIMB 8255 / S1) TaxID=269796 RepID=Q2RWL9_RHORT|nr:hypothetical protein [Rhodospirillum rubrum]ABC21476.1 hypothetical protein Rru_A0672 [Rhodospirillum rubrum ATCC 11170]AEO47158.1 hypothetical protein F11_03440 [Rhodospirillum rubrum F11]MBK1663987.1 hypothetical protein [Rhodospirillum rubrum]MBK1675455.1 hypothetical protein [Rhodospirillum rubrum]MBK5953071.1 hypothetical protein [Rhodospirillum rubrum]